jgi:hypothetical protein
MFVTRVGTGPRTRPYKRRISNARVVDLGRWSQKIRYMRMMSVIGTPISQRIKPVMAAFFP